MSRFLDFCAEGGGFLDIGEEASDFGFGCRGNDVLHYVRNGVKRTVWHRRGGQRLGGFLRSVAKIVVASDAAASLGSSEEQGITGNVEYHASGVLVDDGVWVGGAVVEEIAERLVRVIGTCRLRGGKVDEGNAHGEFNGTGIPEL